MSTSPSLLIVDDDDDFLDLLERRFSRRGYFVVACDSLADALKAAGSRRFDAAVIDRTLPGAGNLELLKKLNELDPQLPVIVLSGWSDPASIAAAKSAGARVYLTKPCELATIEAAVREFVPPGDADSSLP